MIEMKNQLNRRDFIKLAGLMPLSIVTPHFITKLGKSQLSQDGRQNVIIVVFDAFSAYNISLYGYDRETTPNLARIAKKAIVYHNHFAGSNFTTSGTASLLTGTLPWTHRALLPNGVVADPFVTRNFFHAFQNYYRVAYTHNGWAYTLLKQFHNQMDQLIPREKLLLGSYNGLIETLFKNDEDIASVSWERTMKEDGGYSYSLFLSHLYVALEEGKVANLKPMFPRGLPTTGTDNGFLLEDAVDWLGNLATDIPQPFFGYFHFLPPHFPYNTSIEFYNHFNGDGYRPPDKPVDVFATRMVNADILKYRREYDEFILYVDREFGRFYDSLEASGLLENSWVIFTSDHGELFERGIVGHSTDVLYQPVIRVPLLIFEPGRKNGLDVHTTTSAIDLLPTLTYMTGQDMPDWAEGIILPPYSTVAPDPNRNVYVVRAHDNDPHSALTKASTAIIKGRYKLLYYFGYTDFGVKELVKLYDIESDPDELIDLSSSQKDIADELLKELKSKLDEVNKPYL